MWSKIIFIWSLSEISSNYILFMVVKKIAKSVKIFDGVIAKLPSAIFLQTLK